MKKLPYLLFGAFALAGNAFGQTTATTDPVGFVTVGVNANSDATLGLPLHRPTALQTTVTSVAGNVITTNASLTASQFVYNGATITDHFYVQVTASTNANSPVVGLWFQVTANSATGITVDPASASQTLQAQGLAANDTIVVIPYWSLKTLFPSGGAIPQSPDPFNPQGLVLTYSGTTTGVNIAPSKSYLYYPGTGSPAGWYDASSLTQSDDLILNPDEFIVIRNLSSAKTVTITGSVPMSKLSTIVGTLNSTKSQDNFVSTPFPVSMSLGESKLYESGAVLPSPDLFNPTDVVYLYSESATGVNAAPNVAYCYYSGTDAPVGWYDISNPTVPLDSVKLLTPGRGFIIRKKGGALVTSVWSAPKPY